MNIWFYFVFAYSLIAISVIMYRYFVILTFNNKSYPESQKSVAIIIPSYNEDPISFRKCVQSAIHQTHLNTKVIIIDDGSKIDMSNYLSGLKDKVIFHRFTKNQGKRKAQTWGIFHTSAEFIVTVDSDTVLDRDAVKEIIKPFYDKRIGSVAGNVKISNQNTNLLTKMIGARYYNAFLMERRCQGLTSSMVCNGGPLSAYRRALLLKYLPDYNSQTFLGNKCHYGDDRRLTTYMHIAGAKTSFSEKAIAWTEIPTNVQSLLKMMTRWKKSFYRETWLALGYMWKNSLLSFENLYGLLMPFASFFIRINILILCLVHPIYFLWYLFIIGFMAFFRSILMFYENGSEAFYNIMYAYFHEVIVYWLNFYALFTLKDNKWGTR